MAPVSADLPLLFAGRALRLFGYGLLSVVLVLYLAALGLGEGAIGLLLSLALFGDVGLSLWITTSADRRGRRRMLLLGALLVVFAGVLLAAARPLWLVGLAALVGVISPSGNEVGPFLSIEHAALSQLAADRRRTRLLAWYNLTGSLATALGALLSGLLVARLTGLGWSDEAAYRAPVIVYAAVGVALALLFLRLSPAVEATSAAAPAERRLGLHRSRRPVLRLSGLFALDAFAGGFIVQSLVAYWFLVRFDAPPALLGAVFFAANVLGGLSGLVAERLAGRFGLIRTMVFTHLPSNVLLMMVPLMPGLGSAIAAYVLRSSISQMDVPTRQSYTLAVVSPDERAAASGVTTTARSLGAMLSPALAGQLLAVPAFFGTPFFLAGGLKIVYDLLLYRGFRSVRPPEEKGP